MYIYLISCMVYMYILAVHVHGEFAYMSAEHALGKVFNSTLLEHIVRKHSPHRAIERDQISNKTLFLLPDTCVCPHAPESMVIVAFRKTLCAGQPNLWDYIRCKRVNVIHQACHTLLLLQLALEPNNAILIQTSKSMLSQLYRNSTCYGLLSLFIPRKNTL